VICAATLLSEIGDCRARYPHRDSIAADGGQAPVAIESGKRKGARFRWACNKRLRNALGTLAFNTRRWNPWAADLYAQARARGHSHRRALRTLGRALCRILWRCWQDRTPTTQPDTPGCNSTSPSPSPTRRAPGPTSPPPSEWPAPLSPARAAQRAERTALDSKPPIATHTNIDTGRLSSWESRTCDSVTGSDARRRIVSTRARNAWDGRTPRCGDIARKEGYGQPDELAERSRSFRPTMDQWLCNRDVGAHQCGETPRPHPTVADLGPAQCR